MDSVITFEEVEKEFTGFRLGPLSFAVPQGQFTVLAGSEGAGKSTIIRLLMGLMYPRSGRVTVFDRDTAAYGSRLRQSIGVLFDSCHFYEELNAKEVRRLIGPFYPNWDQAVFEEYAKQLEVPLSKAIRDQSETEKLKVSLIFALAHRPPLLIIDEPAAGFEETFRSQLLAILREKKGEDGCSIVFASDTTAELEEVADYVLFLSQGQVASSQPLRNLLQGYVLAAGRIRYLHPRVQNAFVHIAEKDGQFEGLIASDRPELAELKEHASLQEPSLQDVLSHLEGVE